MRETVEPTVNQYGAEEHPAFGMIRAARVTSTPGVVLFDSDIKHGTTIRITIEAATRKRENNHDWIHGGSKQLIEVELSEAQWASFVSSMNTSGVPATLRWVRGQGQLPELPFAPRLAKSMDAVKGAAERMFGRAKKAMATYEQALKDKAPAKVRNDALRDLHFALENAEANVGYASKVLREDTENVVQKARADIEAMVSQHAAHLGLEAGQASGLLELPVLEGETVEAIEG
ncbi:hypothetical protein [Longimicrobium sp.]|jgi:hypothetical protein|uniref:hypothetical protein n=1 Tax=Longimicrobium sp. TaxID=2029185 RepID=UPI002ED8252A